MMAFDDTKNSSKTLDFLFFCNTNGSAEIRQQGENEDVITIARTTHDVITIARTTHSMIATTASNDTVEFFSKVLVEFDEFIEFI